MSEQPYKWMNLKEDFLTIEVKVVPNSSKNILIFEEEYLKIKLTAPPVDNKANSALIDYLAKQLKVPKSSVELLSGATSKNKRFKLPVSTCEKLLSLSKQ